MSSITSFPAIRSWPASLPERCRIGNKKQAGKSRPVCHCEADSNSCRSVVIVATAAVVVIIVAVMVAIVTAVTAIVVMAMVAIPAIVMAVVRLRAIVVGVVRRRHVDHATWFGVTVVLAVTPAILLDIDRAAVAAVIRMTGDIKHVAKIDRDADAGLGL